MKIPSELKRLRARLVRFVVEMLKTRIAMKRLQRMAADPHLKYFGEEKSMNMNSTAGNFNNQYEFSCSRSSSTNSGIGRFLLRAFVPSCIHVNVKAEVESGVNVKDEVEYESGDVGIPEIACDKDDGQCVSYMDPQFSANSDESNSDSCTCVSTTRCSNCSLSSEIDKKAEEFIAAFYQQMRLQRQDSYVKCQEMLARGCS